MTETQVPYRLTGAAYDVLELGSRPDQVVEAARDARDLLATLAEAGGYLADQAAALALRLEQCLPPEPAPPGDQRPWGTNHLGVW